MSMNKKLGIILGTALGVTLAAAGAVAYSLKEPEQPKEAITTVQGPAENWTHVTDSDTDNEVFVDLSSAKYADGRYARVWVLINRAKPMSDGTKSTMTLTYIDCQEDQFKIDSGHGTDGTYGHGNSTGPIQGGPVEHIVPGSVSSAIAEAVCKPLTEPEPAPNKPTGFENKNI